MSSNATVGSKVTHELRELLQIALYIYVCLGALLLYTASITGASGILGPGKLRQIFFSAPTA